MHCSVCNREHGPAEQCAAEQPHKTQHARLSEDQQVPVGLDNPFWKPEREKRSM